MDSLHLWISETFSLGMLMRFVHSFTEIYLDMSFYLFIGLFCVSLVSLLFPKRKITQYLVQNKTASWINGSLIGVPMPLCSCGVIPMAKYFKESGVSKGGISSFLISTPTTGIDSILVYYGLLGPVAAIIRPISSFVLGIFGGFFMDRAFPQKKEAKPSEESFSVETSMPFKERAKTSFKYGFIGFLDDLHGEFLKAIILTALIMSLISDNSVIFQYFMGGGITSYLSVILIGLPMYLCATESVPMALAFMAKGMSIGTAFVFLSVGPVLSLASIVMLRTIFSRKELIYFIFYIVISSIFLGYFVDFLYKSFNFSIPKFSGGMIERNFIHYLFSACFTIFLFISFYRRYFLKITEEEEECSTCPSTCQSQSCGDEGTIDESEKGLVFLGIEGLQCESNCGDCEGSIEEAFKKRGIAVEVSLEKKKVYYHKSLQVQGEIKKILEESGHKLV